MSRVWFRVGEHGPFPQLHAPGFEGGTDVIEAAEPVGVEALVAKPAVDALDVTVLHGPAWLDVDQFDLAVLGPAQRSIPSSLQARRSLRLCSVCTNATSALRPASSSRLFLSPTSGFPSPG